MSKKLKFKKVLKWAAVSVCAVFIAVFLFLMFYGVPRPPAIATAGVPRVPWKPLVKSTWMVKQMMASTGFAAWYPSERRMLVYAAWRFTPQLHVLSEPGGQREGLIFLRDMPGDIRFNPDANKNYFVFSMDVNGDERYQLYRFHLSDKTYHRFTDGALRNYPGYFNARGDIFAYISSRRLGRESDIHIIDPEHPESDRMICETKGLWRLGPWSPVGNQILAWEAVSSELRRVHMLDVETGEMKNLFPNETDKIIHGAAVWCKDGKSIYFVSDKDSEFMILRRLDLSTGNVRPLSAHIPWDIEDCITSPDGKYLALVINEDGLPTLHLMDTKTERIWKVDDLPDGFLVGIAFHSQRNEIALTIIAPEGIASVYSYNVDSQEMTHWTHGGSRDGDRLPAPRLIHCPTFDKVDGKPRMIPAFVFDAASDFKGRRPVIIEIHGGPMMQAQPISLPPRDFIRKEGVTVICPNYRGSSGYGKTFLGLDDGYSREDGVKDIGALLDWISTQSDLDAQRIAVFGESYGGYMTLASLTQYSDRIRCGIDLYGISNFVTWLENSEDFGQDWRRTEWGDERDPEMRAFLESISPANKADQIKAPLLVFQGRIDPRVPVSESRQIVDRVRAQGGEVWYIEAANEGHGIMRFENGCYVGAAAFAFLEKHLLEKD